MVYCKDNCDTDFGGNNDFFQKKVLKSKFLNENWRIKAYISVVKMAKHLENKYRDITWTL